MDFDEFSKDYDRIHTENVKISGETSDYFSKYKLKVINNFYLENKINKKIRFLDLGCGTGKIERYIFSYFPKAEVYGIDPSAESIKAAASTNTKALFSIYDGKKIPFKNDFFNAGLLSCVLHHILPNNRKQILKEARRVLKKDGYLFIFEHNPLNPLTKYAVKTCVFDRDAILLGKGNCVNILKNSGFSIRETKYIVFFPKILRFLRKFEEKLNWCPLGAQYSIVACKKWQEENFLF